MQAVDARVFHASETGRRYWYLGISQDRPPASLLAGQILRRNNLQLQDVMAVIVQ